MSDVNPTNDIDIRLPQLGDDVLYMLKRGAQGVAARPAKVVHVDSAVPTRVNLLVFLDGMNDTLYLTNKSQGYLLWVTGVEYDFQETFHTWHWRE